MPASLTILAASLGTALAKGAGVWTDPNHYTGKGFAGIRIVAEDPPHVLKLVGTDDGVSWFSLTGTCSGDGMRTIKFDFSPKSGPADLTGAWASGQSGATTITWPDGNAWTLLAAPTDAWRSSDGLDDHAGLFVDPNHFVAPESFAGTRYIAEDPPHELKMVGTDDGTSWWSLQGSCTGEQMDSIHFDFSHKGGPSDLTGVWKAGGPGGAGTITWPDGNAWYKVGTLPASGAPVDSLSAALALAGLVLIVVAAKALNRRWQTREQQKELAAFDEAVEKGGHVLAGRAS